MVLRSLRSGGVPKLVPQPVELREWAAPRFLDGEHPVGEFMDAVLEQIEQEGST